MPLAVVFQDGSVMTIPHQGDWTLRKQMKEARSVRDDANVNVKKTEPHARIVEVEYRIVREVK